MNATEIANCAREACPAAALADADRALDAFTGATTSKAPCPRLLDASMLADGEAGDRVEEIRAHVGGCVECQRVIGDALQLAALADASR